MTDRLTTSIPEHLSIINNNILQMINGSFDINNTQSITEKTNIVQGSTKPIKCSKYGSYQLFEKVSSEWNYSMKLSEDTETIFSKIKIPELNDETKQFIKNHKLYDGINWLLLALDLYFPSIDFDIELLPADEGEESLLALKIYDTNSALDFRKIKHSFCERMLIEGRRDIYDVLSIFQRRVRNNNDGKTLSMRERLLVEGYHDIYKSIFQRRVRKDGCQALSWYSSLTAV